MKSRPQSEAGERRSGGGVSRGKEPKGRWLRPVAGTGRPTWGGRTSACAMDERPSCGEIFLRRCGEWSFGLGLALCLFRDLLELNIMLHPFTVHWCISRRWTALKWIFNAPLSQNVFRHTLHCTLFLPVVGLMNGVPRFGGMFPDAPHWPPPGLLPGEWGFLPGIPGGLPNGAA